MDFFSVILAFYYSNTKLLSFVNYMKLFKRNTLEPNMVNCFVLTVLAVPLSGHLGLFLILILVNGGF